MKIALVAPSDRSCGPIAEQMASRATVELLTTCVGPDGARGNYFDPGETALGSAVLRRFRCDYSPVASLEARLRNVVRSGDSTLPLEERWIQERGPCSSALLEHIEARRDEFDAFVFFELEAATTVLGLPTVRTAVLAPRVEDWDVPRCTVLLSTLARARGFVFDSEEEARRANEVLALNRPSAIAEGSSCAPYLEVLEQVTGPRL